MRIRIFAASLVLGLASYSMARETVNIPHELSQLMLNPEFSDAISKARLEAAKRGCHLDALESLQFDSVKTRDDVEIAIIELKCFEGVRSPLSSQPVNFSKLGRLVVKYVYPADGLSISVVFEAYKGH